LASSVIAAVRDLDCNTVDEVFSSTQKDCEPVAKENRTADGHFDYRLDPGTLKVAIVVLKLPHLLIKLLPLNDIKFKQFQYLRLQKKIILNISILVLVEQHVNVPKTSMAFVIELRCQEEDGGGNHFQILIIESKLSKNEPIKDGNGKEESSSFCLIVILSSIEPINHPGPHVTHLKLLTPARQLPLRKILTFRVSVFKNENNF
jgi:hypothetical protein